MSSNKILFGFHAVGVRLKVDPHSIFEIWVDAQRRDARMKQLIARIEANSVLLHEVDAAQLASLVGHSHHQGVVARVKAISEKRTLAEILEDVLDEGDKAPLFLILDGVTDPHNLGACLRVADGVGVHAVVAPKDHAVGLNATVAKVASGAAETVPYVMVTNLARTIQELQKADVRIIGTSDEATTSLYELDLTGPIALVMGAEDKGMRRLTKEKCDDLVYIPMNGAVESLNVSVASAVALYEIWRQRQLT